MKSPPDKVWPEHGRARFFGAAGGDLWRIDPAAGVTNLTVTFAPEVAAVTWPSMTNWGTDQYRIPGRTYGETVVAVEEGRTVAAHLVDLTTGAIQALDRPEPGAGLVAYGPATKTAIFYAADRNGLHVWRKAVGRDGTTSLVDGNGFLREIAEGRYRKIEYRSLDGEQLTGWIILPPDYREGARYPLVTWVYAGAVYRDQEPHYGIASNNSLNVQLFAGQGYAVLLPSMPLGAEGTIDDPMLRLSSGVLPAVDKAIELGIADSTRLFLAGQSFGGYSTYGLITQTRRFTAAIALAGLSNLISLYGQFDARVRYADHPQENLFQAALMESAQVRMGGPPWKDTGRYLRNSPIFYVDRVETPLLIIQGDLDYVAMQQGEEFFTSLYRQGKRASFVRYWGEGHVLESPANIRDMWRRMFAWMEQFSPGSAKP
jgi:dipeptidyl aminopeptidase/acylaminoacyl peptidase